MQEHERSLQEYSLDCLRWTIKGQDKADDEIYIFGHYNTSVWIMDLVYVVVL